MASAEEASVGVGAVSVLVAVVVIGGTLVDIIANDAIASPPAPRTESTVSRDAFHNDLDVPLGGRGKFQLSGLLAKSGETQRKGLGSVTQNKGLASGSRPRLGLLFEENVRTVQDGLKFRALVLGRGA